MTLASLTKRVRYWQNHPSLARLGLGPWDIKVVWLDADAEGFEDLALGPDDVVASCDPHHEFDEAEIAFNRDRLEEADLDRVIVHELLHVFMRDFDEAQTAGLERCMSVPTAKDFEGRLRHEREGVVDRLAHTIVALDRK